MFVFNSLATSSGSLFGAGIASFLAKILQLKFGISSFITGVVIGTVLVPGTVGENNLSLCNVVTILLILFLIG